MKTIIKICGVKTPEIAEYAINAGATHVGIILAAESRRFVDIETAMKIAQTTIKMGAIPVGVFTDSSADDITKKANLIGIKHIQCHGTLSKRSHHLLPDEFTRIYAMSVDKNGEILPDHEDRIEHLNPKRDFLIFDREKGGGGESFNHQQFYYHGVFPFLIAGGLNPINAKAAHEKTKAYGVDISSGVENKSGEKDKALIKQFIESVTC
jgi:phosphoribosylanthranilate isomerase